jgi:tetratricopeptide (TPR) repeat protein
MLRTKFFLLPFLLLFFLGVISVSSQQSGEKTVKTEAEKWREDLRVMADEMPKRHRNLFHTMTREQFESAVKSLDTRIPQLARHQIIVEMAKIAAMVGDGHTNIYPSRDAKIGFQALPIKLYFFKDGLFVRGAKPEKSALVGARVVQIGSVSSEQAFSRVKEMVGRDNDIGVKFFAAQLLVMPEVLHALGMTDGVENARFVVEKNGQRQTISLSPTGLADIVSGDIDVTWAKKEGWIDMRDASVNPIPHWLKNPADKFWFEFLPDTKTLYVQYNEVNNKNNETIEDFSKRLFAFVEANPVDRFVFDMRLNRGGNNALNKPLLLNIIKSHKIDQKGKLFAIVGRSTFSAAQNMVNDLERFTNTIFVGEPSGSKLNHYGDSRRITLSNSGITVRVSTILWQVNEKDTRHWTAPQLTAELSSEEYRQNIDPALKLVQNYVPSKSLVELLEEPLVKNDIAAAKASFLQFRADPLNKFYDVEKEMYVLTNRLLRTNNFDAAIEVLKLNLIANPLSAIGYTALGDVYKAKKDNAQARWAYEKAVELNPRDFDVKDKLKQVMQ